MMVTAAPLSGLLGNLRLRSLRLQQALVVLGLLVAHSRASALITPSVALTASSPAVTSGTAITLTAYVHATTGGPYGGQVAFCDPAAAHCTDIHQLGTATLLAGYATFKTTPGPGSHSYKAIYLGNASFATSTSASVAVSVTPPRASATSITQGGTSGSYTLFSFVSGTGVAAPSGTVSFLDTSNSNYVLGTATLGAGTSTLALVSGSSCFLGTGSGASGIAVGDFNRDGIPDLAVANTAANTITICLGHVDGTFTTVTQSLPSSATSPNSLAVGDFNNDGILDLVVGTSKNTPPNSESITVLQGRGDGTFTASTTLPGAYTASSPVVGDFDGDGNLDVAFLGNDVSYSYIFLSYGNGDGTFNAPMAMAQPQYTYYETLLAADLNNDGRTDLIYTSQSNPSVTVELGTSARTFTVKGPQPLAGSPSGPLAVGDFDADGNLDLAVAYIGSIGVLKGNGDGTFAAGSSVPLHTPSLSIAVADVNGDGKADLVATLSVSGNNVLAIAGNGDGTFSSTQATGSVSYAGALAVGDFNADGFADVAVVNGDNGSLVLGNPNAAATGTASVPTPVGTGTHQVIASFPGDPNFAASVSGSSGLSAVRVSGQQLILSASPASGVAGQAVTLTATMNPYAAQGHSTDGELVTFSTFPGGHVLGQGALSSGVATLTLSTLGVGTSTIEAMYPGDANFYSQASNDVAYAVAGSTSTALAITGAGGAVNSVAFGTPVSLTATVLSGSAPVTPGLVAFCDATAQDCTDIHRLGTAQLTSSGTATLRLSPAIGSHLYRAIFLGTTKEAASSSSNAPLTVTGLFRSTTSLVSSGSPGNYTLTASISSLSHSPIAGTVSFADTSNAGASLGSGTISTSSFTFALASPQTITTGIQPKGVATGDFNGDGKPDFVVANYGDSTLTVELGNGDGTFTSTANISAGLSNPDAVLVGDFNSDGKQDLAVANYAGGTVSIFLGNGDGTFTSGSSINALAPQALAGGDFNNDGIADLAVASSSGDRVSVFLGDGDGTFTAASGSALTAGNYPSAMVSGDFNNDGSQDLAVANVTDRTITIFFGAGNGQFPSSRTLLNVGSSYALGTADLDGDGNADLIALDSGGNTVTVLRGDGTGAFSALASPVTAPNPTAVAIGDVNGDGIPDIVTANDNAGSTLDVFFGDGDGTFQAALAYSTGLLPQALALADFNGDGSADIVTANYGGNNASVLLAQTQQSAAVSVTGISPMGSGTGHAAQATYLGDAAHASSTSNLVSLTPLAYAASPSFSPAAGSYTAAQSVILSSATAGATIFYTTDGSTPTTSSPQYLGPVAVSSSETVKAIASAPNYQTSPVATAVYTVNYPPTITSQPLSQTINAGGTATLTVVASSGTTAAYQWYNGASPSTASPIAGATGSAYTTPVLTTSSSYWVQVKNASSVPANSGTATITVITPPAITTQPAGQTINSGSSATLSVSASGTAPLAYQWFSGTSPNSNSPVAHATGATYTTPALTTTASFWVQVNNASGVPANSGTVVVTVITPPAITGQPAPQTVNSGSTATLTVAATGSATLAYQWYSGSSPSTAAPISGATGPTYTTSALTTTSSFWVQVSNSSGVPANSATATVTVIAPPAITNPPASQTVNAGSTATLAVSASGSAPLSYQWFSGASPNTAAPIAGATGSTYTTPALTATANFWVQVSNASGIPANSSTAVITVITPPSITTQPASQTITSGSPVTLSVSASGTAPLSYQWSSGMGTSPLTPIAGAIGASYTAPGLTTTTLFAVQVSNSSGVQVNSAVATVTVIAKPAITGQPASQSVNAGTSATLVVGASGTNPTFQWFAGTSGSTAAPIAGATGASYTTSALTSTSSFWVRVSNQGGSADSATATVTVIQGPSCTLSVQPGGTALAAIARAVCSDPQNQALSVSLDWGDGTPVVVIAATATSTHTYARAGVYAVAVSAKNSSGLTGSATVRVSPSQSPVCTLGVVQGQISTITTQYPVTVSGGCTDPQGQPLTVSLDWGDGTVVSPGASPYAHTYSSPTTVNYQVVLTATDSSGLTGSSAPQPVQIVPAQPIPAGGSTPVTSTIPAPLVAPAAPLQVTFVCSSVSVQVNGQTVTTIPSAYGISCTSPAVQLSSAATPVNVTITTSNGLMAKGPGGHAVSTVALCGLAFPFAGLALLLPVAPGRRRRLTALMVACMLCVSLAGCGGYFQAPVAAATPSGLYYVTLVETVVPPQVAPTGFVQTSLIVPLPVTH